MARVRHDGLRWAPHEERGAHGGDEAVRRRNRRKIGTEKGVEALGVGQTLPTGRGPDKDGRAASLVATKRPARG